MQQLDMNLTLIVSVIAAAVAGAAGFGLAWELQAGNITQLELDHANERITIQRAARQTLERVTGQIATAQANATTRGIRLRATAVAVGNAAGGLRIKTTDAVRAAAADPAVCSDTAATLGKLFDASVTQYRELAERTDRHVIDVQALTERTQGHSGIQPPTDSWPKE